MKCNGLNKMLANVKHVLILSTNMSRVRNTWFLSAQEMYAIEGKGELMLAFKKTLGMA